MNRTMKRTILAALAALTLGAPAVAQKAISVSVPANLSDAAAVEAFRDDVAGAVRKVCRDVQGPMLGFNIYGVRKCIADTSNEVAKLDTTGILSAELIRERSYQLAAK